MPAEISSMKSLWARVVADRQFLLAICFGPVTWIVLWLFFGKPEISGITAKVFLSSVLLYPIIEEFAFRGFIQTWLLEKPIGKRPVAAKISTANVLTSVTFAAFHLFNQPPVWAALVFLPSLVFGYFRERFDAVTPSVLLHSWYNLGFLWLFS